MAERPDATDPIAEAARIIRGARYLTAFTGAGISVESGIPPFRGEGGIWEKYDPRMFDIDFFRAHPDRSWPLLKEIFYGSGLRQARPNRAHEVLAAWEKRGLLRVVITQNIDNLHFAAGSRNVVEYHGNTRELVCTACGARTPANPGRLDTLPPRCHCGGILKPDFVFFGELIPAAAQAAANRAAEETDCMLVVGSTGEVYPAALVPQRASRHGAKIIEINPERSEFTSAIADLHIPMRAGEALDGIEKALGRVEEELSR